MLHRLAAIALLGLVAACGTSGEEGQGANASASTDGPDAAAGETELMQGADLANEAAAAEAADAAVGGNMSAEDVSAASENAASNH